MVSDVAFDVIKHLRDYVFYMITYMHKYILYNKKEHLKQLNNGE